MALENWFVFMLIIAISFPVIVFTINSFISPQNYTYDNSVNATYDCPSGADCEDLRGFLPITDFYNALMSLPLTLRVLIITFYSFMIGYIAWNLLPFI